MIPAGNGKDKCYVSGSKTFGMKFTDFDNSKEIKITDELNIIEMWIPRDNNYNISFNLFDMKNNLNPIYLFNKSFQINQTNSSLNIHFKPENQTLSYIFYFKSYNSQQLFPELKCPEGNE